MAWTPQDHARDARLKREIIGGNIDRDRTGSRLTSRAREQAIDFAVDNWAKDAGNGEAAKLGIKHVTSGVLKK